MRLVSGPGYLLTPKAARRLDEAAARIYRTGRNGWDGRFDLVLTRAPVPRREAKRLTFLGYGMLAEFAWVAPRASDEVDAVLADAGIGYERFSASHAAGSPGAAEVVGRAWDLAEIGRAYEAFIAEQRPIVTAVTARSSDEEAYAARFQLVHAWRSFLFRDPQLPASLLPPRWPGASAATFFDRHAARLRPAADRFVERCLASATRGGRVGFSEP
jgi:phenylacetic acid degradation operon negative regulatory protein